MSQNPHDTYASEYDAQVQAYDCYITDILFGLCYAYILPGQRMLDAGTGTGLSSQLFAGAGLEVHGMDSSPAMLEICRAKGFTKTLEQHDVMDIPWPYPPGIFDHLVSCGVFHFLPMLEGIFGEARRVLAPGGAFAFTTRAAPGQETPEQDYSQQKSGEFEIFSHSPGYIESLLAQRGFRRLKLQKCFIGEDVFRVWIVRA